MSFEMTMTELANTSCEEIELTASERMELNELGSAAGMPEDAVAEFEAWLDAKETPVTDDELEAMWIAEQEARDAADDDDRTPPPASAAVAPVVVEDATAPAAVRLSHKQFRKLMVLQYAGLRGGKLVAYRGRTYAAREFAGWVELTPAA